MQQFEQSMTELIQDIDPRRINLSADLYNFGDIEKANVNQLPYFLRVGKLKNNSISLPALVPFIDSKGMVYLYNNADEEHAKLYMQNILFELIGKISPNNIDIIIYDPVYLGVPFSYISQVALDNVSVELLTDEQHLLTRLQKYIQYSKEFINNKLLRFNGFLDYWVNSGDSQKQYTLFILNDSNFVRNTAITDIIGRITANTKNNNSFFILSDLDSRKQNFAFFNSEFNIEHHAPFYNELKIDLEYDKVKERIFENLHAIKGKQSQKTVTLETFDIKEGIKFPIGVLNNKKQINFQLGYGKAVYHAIIGGGSGKGKSNLMQVIIKQGFRHSPNELMYLIFDCMGSTDFKDFDNSPNVMVCERSGKIQNVVEKLKIIEVEFETRLKLMDEHNARNIEELIEKGVKVPRLICVIDEFQYLFPTSDYKTAQFAEELLVQKIIKAGRKFGIHLIVATQSLGDGVRRSILDNIPLRIALGMTEAQSNSFLAYNNDGAKNLEKYWAVYNELNGEKDGNLLFNILDYKKL